MTEQYSILHDLIIKTPAYTVFEAVSQPSKINEWWTATCSGVRETGAIYELGFTDYGIWKAKVIEYLPNNVFSLQMVTSDEDWVNTIVRYTLRENAENTVELSFEHSGWRNTNKHFRVSSYCWALYLRILKTFLEKGVRIPYAERDNF